MKASIFVAVEAYLDKKLPAVKYAEADARDFAAILEQHGFGSTDREMLINDQATKTSIESAIRTTLQRLTEHDTLYVYYAGHGFAKIGGDNYITCFDTRTADPDNTSIGLSGLLKQFKESKCNRIVMFLDSCNSGLLASEEWRSIYSDLNQRELETFFESAEHCVCFAACKADERSHPSSSLKHGIWTYHVIQAFDGQNPLALQGTLLTSTSLQNYLKMVVPATLRATNPKAVQTPWMYGSASSDFQLADLEDILAKRRATTQPRVGQLKDSILLVKSIDSIRSLTGFNKSKGHFVPEQHSQSAQSFINAIASAEIKEDVERVRAALKLEFGFKRLELKVENHSDGAATITTPHFNYNVSVVQDSNDPGNVVWRRSVDAIIDPDKVLSDEFEAVFSDVFDTVELSLQEGVNLDQLIDAIEALASDEITVAYDEDEDVTCCVLKIKGHNISIEVTESTFSVIQPRPQSPKQLLQSLFDVQFALTQERDVVAIPFS